MAKKSIDLFINAFSIYNQNRYKNDSAIANRFKNLTAADLEFTSVQGGMDNTPVNVALVCAARAFKSAAADQTFTKANINNAKIATFTTKTLDGVTDQASFLEAIKHIGVGGVYQVAVPELNGKTALLVIHAPIDPDTPEASVESMTVEAVKTTIDAAMIYAFDMGNRSAQVVDSTIQIEDQYIYGKVYYAPVGASELIVPATDYGSLDSADYDSTM